MISTSRWDLLIEKTKTLLKSGENKIMLDILKEFKSVISDSIQNDFLDKRNIEIFIEGLETVTYCLLKITGSMRIKDEEIRSLLRTIFDSVFIFKESTISSNFERIISVLVFNQLQWNKTEGNEILRNLINVLKYTSQDLSTPSCSFQNLNEILSKNAISKLDRDENCLFSNCIAANILSAIFLHNHSIIELDPKFYEEIWEICLKLLETRTWDSSNSWISDVILSSLREILRITRNSPLDRLKTVNKLLGAIVRFVKNVKPSFEALNSSIFSNLEFFEVFFEENSDMLIFNKEMRDLMLQCLFLYLEICSYYEEDEFGLLDLISHWINSVSMSFDSPPEMSKKICIESIDISVTNIQRIVTKNSNSKIGLKTIALLPKYLDIVASLTGILQISKTDLFDWIEKELHEISSLENPKWINILQALISVKNPYCQNYFKKFVPSCDYLWMLIKKRESQKTVNKLAILVGSCQFLDFDEGGKHVIPILLLNCLRDFTKMFGSKWENFRFHIGGKNIVNSTCTLNELEEYVQFGDPKDEEFWKIRAVACALMIDRKPYHLVQLVSDMAICVILKSSNIRPLLSYLVHFVKDNYLLGIDIANALLEYLCNNKSFNDDGMKEVFSTTSTILCLAANRGSLCNKCRKFGVLNSESVCCLKINEKWIALLIKLFLEMKDKLLMESLEEFFKMCRSIIQHSDSNRIPILLSPFLRSINLTYTKTPELFGHIWELIENQRQMKDLKMIQFYVPIFARIFQTKSHKKSQSIYQLIDIVCSPTMPNMIKVALMACCFTEESFSQMGNRKILNSKLIKMVMSTNRNTNFSTQSELFQITFKKHTLVFCRAFITRLFLEELSDEAVVREIVRNFISRLKIWFRIATISRTLDSVRPGLLYYCLSAATRGQSPLEICMIIDFLSQELISTNSEKIIEGSMNDLNAIKLQRNIMIKEMFPVLIQNCKLDFSKSNEQIWRFCEEYCNFSAKDMIEVINEHRKEVFQRLVLVSAESFENVEGSSPIIEILKNLYESLHKGKRFSIPSAMDFRNEGVELILMFRSCFISDEFFLFRHNAANSFKLVLQMVSKQFFDENWWSIYRVICHMPIDLDVSQKCWMIFIDRVDYSILRICIWRIVANVSRFVNPKDAILRIWKRMNYLNENENHDFNLIEQQFWIRPKSLGNNQVVKNQTRHIDDILEALRRISKYPTNLIIRNIGNDIDKGIIWKSDVCKLISSLIGALWETENDAQKDEISIILGKNPIFTSENADLDFKRWDDVSISERSLQQSQDFLAQCAFLVERLDQTRYLEYVDRSFCDIHKYIDCTKFEDIEERKIIEGLKVMYTHMNYQRKPSTYIDEEFFGEQRSIQLTVDSFNRWLTIMIIMCIKQGKRKLDVFIPLAYTDCTQFLIKMLTRILIITIIENNDEVIKTTFKEFEYVLNTAFNRRITKLDRLPACFVFYFFDFLYYYINSEEMRKDKDGRKLLQVFWTNILEISIKDEHGTPLLVKVAEKFGMEKRCILWMEMMMEIKQRSNVASEKKFEASYYFVLMNLFARIHDLNGVRGAYSRLSRIQIDHTLGKIRLREAFGNVAEASIFSESSEKWEHFDLMKLVQQNYEELYETSYMGNLLEQEEYEDYESSIKSLKEWVNNDKNFGESPAVFSRSICLRAFETKIIKMVNENENIEGIIFDAKKKVLERLAEHSLGGRCSYETSVPFIVQIQQLEEIRRIHNSTAEEIVDNNSAVWNDLGTRLNESQQRLSIVEPILRVRIAIISNMMKKCGDREKVTKIKALIVESYLHCARVARLQGCKERAQAYIINAKKVTPFDNKIVLEEAKLQIQTCDEDGGMNLLNNILTNTFGELSKHFGDTQQSANLDLKTAAKIKIENYPQEEKNLYSSVQMLRISHMIKAGNTIMFEQIYDETTNLLSAFVSSGVMYEAAWLLDYLFHFIERNSLTVLPLLKAYREVAKYERNTVLQARAIERMTSLWLSNTAKLKMKIDEGKSDYAKEMITQMQVMNSEIKDALKDIGWKAFYPAYAMLARHIDHKDKEVFMTIKQMMIHLIIQLPHQCMWQSVYLLRLLDCDKIERYKEVLSHVKRKHPCYSTIIDQYDFASATFVAISKKVQDRNCMLSKAVPQMVNVVRNKKYDPKFLELDRRNGPEKEMISGIMVPIRSDIDASVQEAKESLYSDYVSACRIDDRYILHDFNEKVKILASNTKPVLIELTLLSGRKVRLICKKDDDLTKDYHFSKIVEMCNDLLTKDEQTRICNMQATTYSVIPLANTGGIIEFMENVSPYFEVLDKYMNLKPEKIGQWRNYLQTVNHDRKVDYFRDVCCKETPLVMAKWFRQQYPEAGKWFSSRKLFAKSSAVMSIIGYIFGLGDRHTRNLMIHIPSGKCVHVDFDMIFNKADFLGIPEVVPFRLTRNMVNGMGEVALDGEFRVVSETTLRVFRENSYEIEKYIADLPDLITSPELGKATEKYDMKEAKRLVSGRLRGQIVTAKVYRSNPISNPMKVAQLASSLIELATSDEKLAEMFAGWLPFV